jgi:hypothetical protein
MNLYKEAWVKMTLVDTKVEVQYKTEVLAWRVFPDQYAQWKFQRKP